MNPFPGANARTRAQPSKWQRQLKKVYYKIQKHHKLRHTQRPAFLCVYVFIFCRSGKEYDDILWATRETVSVWHLASRNHHLPEWNTNGTITPAQQHTCSSFETHIRPNCTDRPARGTASSARGIHVYPLVFRSFFSSSLYGFPKLCAMAQLWQPRDKTPVEHHAELCTYGRRFPTQDVNCTAHCDALKVTMKLFCGANRSVAIRVNCAALECCGSPGGPQSNLFSARRHFAHRRTILPHI